MPRIKVAAKADRTLDGVVFASKAEMTRYAELKLLERAGEIRSLERQPFFPFIIHGQPVMMRSERYKNGRPCGYTADFRYWERFDKRGCEVIEDHKGYQTDIARLRIAVAEAIFGIQVRITGKAAMTKSVRKRTNRLT